MKRTVLALIAACLCLNGAFAQTAKDYVDQGNRYLQQRDYDRAITAFTQAIRLAPNNFAGYLGRASVL